MAQKVIYNGSTHTIKVKSGTINLDVQKDLYSDAKDDWLNEVNNLHKYSFPWITIGGNDIGNGQIAPIFYFLQSPWKIETNGDGELHSFSLNLYATDENGNPRDPFNIIPGDSVTNKISDIAGSDLLQIIKDNIDIVLSMLWTNNEKEQFRDALGIDGNKQIAKEGQLQENTAWSRKASDNAEQANQKLN